MTGVWDTKADRVNIGDKLRDVTPDRVEIDENGITHYIFKKLLFNNPWYDIPDDDLELFENYVEGGSRIYPSDGSIPCDVVAGEARKVINKLVACSEDPNNNYLTTAKEALKRGKKELVRGTLKLYLGKYTTRDWRRKRFTDDIDFWTFQVNVLEHSLKECAFMKNKETGEWVKKVEWISPYKKEIKSDILFAANNLNLLLDFGAGGYLGGSSLKEIFAKKIKRGHEVDLSDLINVAMVNDGKTGEHVDEWNVAFSAFEEAANTRNSRTTSNFISLFRYAYTIANHLDRVAQVLLKYNDRILDEKLYLDEDLERLCRTSIHWEAHLKEKGPDETRKMFHDFFHQEAQEKPIQAKNLRNFADKLLDLLNIKYKYLEIIFEIED